VAQKQRLDALLVARGLCPSRQAAQRSIRAGEVRVNEAVVDKPGTPIRPSASIRLLAKPPYVSRGGEKLARALAAFAIPVSGRICLDAGISTGGFTDCLLQAGAARTYGIDVGYGQVAWPLRQDERVVLCERTNIRHLSPQQLYGEAPRADLGVADVSFVSLTKILAPLWQLLVSPREAIVLVKPQFEVGKGYFARAASKGVVRDPGEHVRAIEGVLQAAQGVGWQASGLTPSPRPGPAGNVEYLLWLRAREPAALDGATIRATVAGALAPEAR